MTFIKTESPITLESECGAIYHIIPNNGTVFIEIDAHGSEPLNPPDWSKEGGFAKPEFQRNQESAQDWTPEEEMEDEGDAEDFRLEVAKPEKQKQPMDDINSWPLP